MAGQTQAQDWPRLDELKSSSRNPFLVQGCHADLCGKEWDSNAKVLQNNYDMGPSIARSDSFDVQHYDLTLDVTAYNQQAMSGHAVIDFDVLTGGGSRVWWDFVGMAVDSVQWNGVGAVHHHWGPELHVDAPGVMEAGEAVTLDVWYSGQPNDDPNWGGVYYASDLIYNLGIGLTSIPPNFGKVWYPCFDNFVERATYTYRIKVQEVGGPTTKATCSKKPSWVATRSCGFGRWITPSPRTSAPSPWGLTWTTTTCTKGRTATSRCA